MQFKRRLVGRQVSLLSMFLWFHVGETPSGQKIVVLSALYIKQIKNIMKYQLFTNASNCIRHLKVIISEWPILDLIELFKIYCTPGSPNLQHFLYILCQIYVLCNLRIARKLVKLQKINKLHIFGGWKEIIRIIVLSETPPPPWPSYRRPPRYSLETPGFSSEALYF